MQPGSPVPGAFQPLPLGAIQPRGWLRDQLRIQADGLSGHLDEFWPDVARSRWIGGDAEGWERGPYWLDGIVPLAFLLNDDRLIAKARFWIDAILTRQHPDGWLGPKSDPRAGSGVKEMDPWPLYVLLKAMTQWHEATQDARILPAMERALRRIQSLLADRPLQSWAGMRWPDFALSLLWLHARAPEPWLLDLARTAQAQGYDWQAHFRDFRYTEKQPQWTQENHVVNHAMALKEPAIRFRLCGDPQAAQEARDAIATLDRYHGQATGIFSGDESLAGRDPWQGTELCAVVEALFSLETLMAAFGDPAFGDRLEKIAFNALPATFTPDMWAHQYDQQANQVLCTIAKRPWTNNGDDSNIYGLEPNFGCCTANMHQGWPKFVSHLWMATPEGGLAAVAYGPCKVSAQLPDGTQIAITGETEYPFRDTVRLTLDADRPARFPLALRIPAWTRGATVQINAESPQPVSAGTFHAIERDWNPGDTLALRLPMDICLERRPRNAVTVARGPLVYALRMGERFEVLQGAPPQADYAVHPTTPWNIGLALGSDSPAELITVTEAPVGPVPFAPDSAPIRLSVPARRVPQWTLQDNVAGPLPESPVAAAEPVETATLIPYGCTNLRITEFPEVI